MISVWPKFYSFDPEMVLYFHFTFKPFSGHAQKRERARERERERDSTEERSHQHPAPAKARSIHIQELRRTQKTQDWARSSSNAPIIRSWTHSLDRRARPLNPFLRSSSSSIIKPIRHRWSRTRDAPFVKPKIVPPNRRSACSGSILLWWRGWFLFCCSLTRTDLWFDDFFFFVGYWEFGFWWILILLELMIYLFGSWENARKCKKHDKIGFFRAFSRIQPNTRKYFPKNILECNQTPENIFLSWK